MTKFNLKSSLVIILTFFLGTKICQIQLLTQRGKNKHCNYRNTKVYSLIQYSVLKIHGNKTLMEEKKTFPISLFLGIETKAEGKLLLRISDRYGNSLPETRGISSSVCASDKEICYNYLKDKKMKG